MEVVETISKGDSNRMSQTKVPVSGLVGASSLAPPSPAGPPKYEFFKVVQDYLDRAAGVIDLPESGDR